MKVAFHFNAHLENMLYHLPIQEKCFQTLLAQDTDQLHLKIFSGDLLIRKFARDQEHLERLIAELLSPHYPIWQDLDPDFHNIIQTQRVYVLAFEGMSGKIRDALNKSLEDYVAYLGAQQVYEANPVHWMLYNQSIGLSYRMFGTELRILYYFADEGYGKDKERENYWRRLPFSSVTFEDLGVRHTIFDKYDSYDHACRVADLSETLGDHLAMLADELLMRLRDMDPHLCNMIYSAFQRLDHFETSEDLSQAAGTCRRILKAFADVVYPPREESIDGHELGEDQYVNRLWAYIKDHTSGKERKVLLADLNDIGKRLDKLYELASKGVHGQISHKEVRRLILGETILLYDLSTLTPPLKESSVPPDINVMKYLLGAS